MNSVNGSGCCTPEAAGGDWLAVKLANTACPEAGMDLGESFEAALAAAGAMGALSPAQAELLRKRSATAAARDAAARLRELRSLIAGALGTLAAGRRLPARLLAELNRELASCGCRRELVGAGDAYDIRVVYEIEEPSDLIMPFANSFAELLAWTDFTRIKRCKDERCSCYFVDTSKNRTRAWCSMERCGNRRKVANYYRRSKETR